MDTFELNKIAGALLGTLIFAMVLGFASEIVFYNEVPEVPGFIVEVAETDEDAVEEVVETVPLAVLLANADASAGEAATRRCSACHTFEEGGANRVGPNLWNVVGGPMAHIDGFGYSSALAERAAAGGEWSFESLNAFLESPRNYLSGTSMAFNGIRDEQERADLIVYMRSLSTNPVPLPEAEAGEAAPAEDAAAAPQDAGAPTADQAAAPAQEEPPAGTADTAAATAETDVATAPAEPATNETGTGADQVAAATAADNPVIALLANADPDNGQRVARRCAACHTFDSGGPNRVGPNLWGVVGRDKAAVDGFRYSSAMAEHGGSWTLENLIAYLQDPRGQVPGTSMIFAGIRDDGDLADLIAYMNAQSDNPLPFQE